MGMKEWLTENCFNSISALLDDGYAIIQNLAEKLIPKLEFNNRLKVVEKLELEFDVNSYKAKEYWVSLKEDEVLQKL